MSGRDVERRLLRLRRLLLLLLLLLLRRSAFFVVFFLFSTVWSGFGGGSGVVVVAAAAAVVAVVIVGDRSGGRGGCNAGIGRNERWSDVVGCGGVEVGSGRVGGGGGGGAGVGDGRKRWAGGGGVDEGAAMATNLPVAVPLPLVGVLGDQAVPKDILPNLALDMGLDGHQDTLGAKLIHVDVIPHLLGLQDEAIKRHKICASTRGAARHFGADEGDVVGLGGPDGRVHQEDRLIFHLSIRSQYLGQFC